MSRRSRAMVTTALVAAIVVTGAVTAYGALVHDELPDLATGSRADAMWAAAGLSAWALSYLVFGGLLLWQRPELRLGWLFLLNAALPGATWLLPNYGRGGPETPGYSLGVILYVLFGTVSALILQIYPTDRFPSGRWRWVTWSLLVGTAMLVLGFGLRLHPTDGLSAVTVLVAVAFTCYIGGMLGSLVMLVARYLRSSGVERAQLKWFLFGFCVALLLWLGPDQLQRLTMLGAFALVGSMVVAVLRFRLFDIDRIISRAVSYGLVTALLLATFAVIVISVSRLLNTDAPWVVALATLAAAALARPVLVRVQSVVDRRFNRARYDAVRIVEAFGARLRDEVHPEAVESGLLGTIAEHLEPASVSLWLRSDP